MLRLIVSLRFNLHSFLSKRTKILSISGVTILKNNAENTGFFGWGWNKLKSAATSSYTYVKNLFVSEKPTVHVVTGVSLMATTAYYKFPPTVMRRSRNWTHALLGINFILLAISGLKQVFSLGRNYGRNEIKNLYEAKLLEMRTQHKATEVRAARLETENETLIAEQETYRSTKAVLEERDRQRSTETDNIRRQIRQSSAISTAFPSSQKTAVTPAPTAASKTASSQPPAQDESTVRPKM